MIILEDYKPRSNFFEDLWKPLAIGLSTALSGLVMLIGKISFNFGKKRNSDLHNIEKRVAKIEGVIFFVDSDNRRTNISKKACDINHKLDNIEIAIIKELKRLNDDNEKK